MKKKVLKSVFALFLIFISNSTFSQQQEYIIGKLIDAKSQEPISFASIRIKDRALGIISNIDGSFKIPLKYKEYGDIIEISSMGYQSKEILIHDFSVYELNNVRLQPAILELEEAVVMAKFKQRKSLSARRIVQKAIEAIPKNYPIKPFSTVGYYRDYQLDNKEYVNLNEAILEVFDKGFNAMDSLTTRTRIYDYQHNKEFRRDTLSNKPYNYERRSKTIDNAYLFGYGGNEFTILKVHDAIRNYQLNTFDFINNVTNGDILKNHYLKKEADAFLDDKALYVIRLIGNKYDYSARGKLYISKDDFAIYKLEYMVHDNRKNNKNGKLGKIGITEKLVFDVVTEYKRNLDNIMYLNYISFHNTFQSLQAPKFVLKTITLNMASRHLVLTFNNKTGVKNAENYENYKGYFKGERIKFERLVVFENQVLLFPKLKTKKQMSMWQALKEAGENNNLNKKNIRFNVKNIQDVRGNLIHEQISKDYSQFREFFVQELKLNPDIPIDSLYMDKLKPIFQNQHIVKPDNFDDYWMNTPLQTIKN